MSYPACPKCGHRPLPADQSLPAACPACGLVLAKFASMPVHAAAPDDADEDDAPQEKFFSYWLLHVPGEVNRTYWYWRIAALVLFAGYTLDIFRTTDIRYGDLGGWFLGKIILPWHEAGHVIFRLFGEFMTILGGTLAQHLFPIILGVALLVKRQE